MEITKDKIKLDGVFPPRSLDEQAKKIIIDYVNDLNSDYYGKLLVNFLRDTINERYKYVTYSYYYALNLLFLYTDYELNTLFTYVLTFNELFTNQIIINRYIKYISENNHFDVNITLNYNIFNMNNLVNQITNLYENHGYVHHYFFFCNAESAYYKLWQNDVQLDPNMYEIGASITSQELLSNLPLNKNIFYETIAAPHMGYITNQALSILGWKKEQILEVLLKAGIFNYTFEKFGNMYVYKIPKFMELGFDNIRPSIKPPIRRNDGLSYPPHIKYMKKFQLEIIYRLVFKIETDWNKVCSSSIFDTNTIKSTAERLYNVQFSQYDNKEEVCSRLHSIERNRELSEDIEDLSRQIILQPGGTQYLKYTNQPESFFKTKEEYEDRTQVDIYKYYNDINDLFQNINKTNIDAYKLAVKYGLKNYVTPMMTKDQIYQVMNNYLQIMQEGRKL